MMTNASEYIKDHIFEKVARNQKVVQNEKVARNTKLAKKFPSNLWKALYILFPSTKQLQKNQSK